MQQGTSAPIPYKYNAWNLRSVYLPVSRQLTLLVLALLATSFLGPSWYLDGSFALTISWIGITYVLPAIICDVRPPSTDRTMLISHMAVFGVSSALFAAATYAFGVGDSIAIIVIGTLPMFFIYRCLSFVHRPIHKTHFAVIPYPGMKVPGNTKYSEYHVLSSPYQNCVYDALVIDSDHSVSKEWVSFIDQCKTQGVKILESRTIQEVSFGKVDLEKLSSSEVECLEPSSAMLNLKRMFDVTMTLLLLPILVPFCSLLVVLIRLDSPGPAIFVQKRVGKNNRVFSMYKFRSMRVAPSSSQQAKFADQDAYRITRLGSFIRKYRIDELPQFINVLKGDMSLIGPRPEQPMFVEQFQAQIPFYDTRNIVRPGITGWAQVNQGYASNTNATREKVEHDLFYIKNLSPSLEFVVMIRTLKTIVTGFGAI